jgi:1-deoxy-D-xylulose-5-phosphate synthase
MAAQDPSLMAITPAMREGSGMVRFSKEYPSQYFDVAIAEQHAVTLATGMAIAGNKPIVAIYSTFLQRGYDQLIHDVAIMNLPVMFAIDRAGLVGADGQTHQGAFDLSFMRCIPNMVIMAPSDENECRQMLYTGHTHTGPSAVRYPRGSGNGTTPEAEFTALEIGKGRIVRKGEKVAILSFGTFLDNALIAADNLNATVADMRFVKPLDEALIRELCDNHDVIVTLEENAIAGGAGAGVIEFMMSEKLMKPVLNLGLPDKFIAQGTQDELHAELGLDAAGIEASIRDYISK